MESNKKNGVNIIVVILLVVVFACLGWFANSFYSSLDKNNSNNGNKKVEEVVDGEEVKLDINSSLVQFLYSEVSYDLDNPVWYFNEEIFSRPNKKDENHVVVGPGDETDFVVADASEEAKMKIVGNILIGRHRNTGGTAPDRRNDVGRHAEYPGREYEHYYTKDQVEKVYHQLYGKNAKLDTSVIISAGLFGLLRYAYDSTTDRYYAYFLDGGGVSGPGGFTAKLDRAIKSNDTITLYQKVKKFDGEDGNNLAEEFELVYTFNIENDDYIFVSKVKKTD